MRTAFAIIAALAAGLCLSGARAGEGKIEPLEIVTASGSHAFEVEIASTPQQLTTGLMRRRAMPADRGMLFDFHAERPVMMWMKNTFIPLDMIFVSKQGIVVTVKRDAQPESEDIISSVLPAYAVLEVNAGVAQRIGLLPGDIVRHSIFSPLAAE